MLTTVLRIHSPMSIISPVSSAIGMNLAGLTIPSLFERHLRRASNPLIFCVSQVYWGWNTTYSSPFIMADFSPSSSWTLSIMFFCISCL